MNHDEMLRIIKNQSVWCNQYYLNKKHESIMYNKQMAKEQRQRRIRKQNNEFKGNVCGFF